MVEKNSIEIFKLDTKQNLDLTKYSEDEINKSKEISKSLNPKEVNSILNYGLELQSKLGNYSSDILQNIRSCDTGEIGGLVTDLLNEIDYIDVDPSQKSLFSKFVNKIPILNKIVRNTKKMLAKYDTVSSNVDNIVVKLDKSRLALFKDNNSLDKMFENNVDFMQDLKSHILGGELRIQELQKEIEDMEASGDFSYELSDKKNYLDRLKKKIVDLKMTGTITLQTLPQIRVIQNNNSLIIEKIQSSVTNTIPLWKNQICIAVALDKQKKAVEIQKRLYETTNTILEKNSSLLKENSINVAKQNELAIADENVLKKVNADLISTLDEIMKIKADGDVKRQAITKELIAIEDELKKKILDVKQEINKNII